MKKQYIIPNVVSVRLTSVRMLAQSPVNEIKGLGSVKYEGNTASGSVSSGDARQVIETPDAWQEW